MRNELFFDKIYNLCEQARRVPEENQEEFIFQTCSNLIKNKKKASNIYSSSDMIELMINYIYYFTQTDFIYPDVFVNSKVSHLSIEN